MGSWDAEELKLNFCTFQKCLFIVTLIIRMIVPTLSIVLLKVGPVKRLVLTVCILKLSFLKQQIM